MIFIDWRKIAASLYSNMYLFVSSSLSPNLDVNEVTKEYPKYIGHSLLEFLIRR